jgi:hypothetical protein
MIVDHFGYVQTGRQVHLILVGGRNVSKHRNGCSFGEVVQGLRGLSDVNCVVKESRGPRLAAVAPDTARPINRKWQERLEGFHKMATQEQFSQ